MIENIYTLLIAACIAGLLFCVIGLIKTEVNYKQSITVLDAVHEYVKDCLAEQKPIEVFYSDVSYARMSNDITAWRLKDTLPPKKFEIIKPYIDKVKNNGKSTK